MADKTHVDLRRVENYLKNKVYAEGILCDKGKGKIKSNFWKTCKKFSVINGDPIYKGKNVLFLKKSANSSSYMMFMRDRGTILKPKRQHFIEVETQHTKNMYEILLAQYS